MKSERGFLGQEGSDSWCISRNDNIVFLGINGETFSFGKNDYQYLRNFAGAIMKITEDDDE